MPSKYTPAPAPAIEELLTKMMKFMNDVIGTLEGFENYLPVVQAELLEVNHRQQVQEENNSLEKEINYRYLQGES